MASAAWVSNLNSVVGNSANAGSSSGIAFNTTVDTLIARFPNDGSGRFFRRFANGQGYWNHRGFARRRCWLRQSSTADANLLGSITSTSSVLIAPQQTNRAIDLGTNASGTLWADRCRTGSCFPAASLQIGIANSGTINVSSGITRPTSTNLELRSGAAININSGFINTGGGTLVWDAGNDAARALTRPRMEFDVTASTVTFGSGDDLKIVINGTAVDTQYKQLNVVGAIDLNGLDLDLSGSYVPIAANHLSSSTNDLADAVIGTFNGLPEGAVISNFLGSGLPASITYQGGSDNNDVVISLLNTPIVTITSGNAVYNNAAYVATASITAVSFRFQVCPLCSTAMLAETNVIATPENVWKRITFALSLQPMQVTTRLNLQLPCSK